VVAGQLDRLSSILHGAAAGVRTPDFETAEGGAIAAAKGGGVGGAAVGGGPSVRRVVGECDEDAVPPGVTTAGVSGSGTWCIPLRGLAGTPRGSIVLLRNDGVVFSGDAPLSDKHGNVLPPDPRLALDPARALPSAEMIRARRAGLLLAGHGAAALFSDGTPSSPAR
jgi:hypothetical protein